MKINFSLLQKYLRQRRKDAYVNAACLAQDQEKPKPDGSSTDVEEAKHDASFVKDAGFDEDRDAACAIQGTVNTAANEYLTFGHFEKAIVHFHQTLSKHLS